MAYSPVRIANSGNSAADTMFWYSFRILPDRLKLIRLYPCGSLGPGIGFILELELAVLQQLPRVTYCAYVHMILASWRCFRYDRKCLFSCIYNPQIIISPASSCTASFNGNRIKNHPKPWTCPLTSCQLHRVASKLLYTSSKHKSLNHMFVYFIVTTLKPTIKPFISAR